MKKSRFPLATLLILAVVLSLFAVSTTFASADTQVPTDSIEAWKFAGGWGMETTYVPDGVHVTIPGADTVGAGNAWSYKAKFPNDTSLIPAFSIEDGKQVIVEFSVRLFDADGNPVSRSQNTTALDIYIKDAYNDATQLGLLRIWTDSGSPKNGNHSCEVFSYDWDHKVESSYWIQGDATAESRFTVCFDRENFISSYVGGQDGLVPLANDEMLAERREALKDIRAIAFYIGGDNGFTANAEVVIRSVNGQSLANTDGYFTDTVAPSFQAAAVAATLNAREEYTIPTEAFDLLSEVTYSLKIGDDVIPGKTFTPTEAGDLDVTLVATDAAGNAAEKTYTFHVVSNIAPPAITAVPAIPDQELAYFGKLILDAPTYTDETGTGTLTLTIRSGEDVVATLTPNADGKFVWFIDSNFVGGAYTFVYEVTNSAGSAASDPITANLTVAEVDRVEFAEDVDGEMLVQYTPAGLLLSAAQPWKDFWFGTFDISDGMDLRFIVNPTTVTGAANEVGCVSLVFVNEDDPNLRVMYRVWVGHSGADCATNVYISTDGGKNYTDITDTGWISRQSGEVNGQYHMGYTADDTFVGERTGGVTRVDMAYEQLAAFFSACPSTRFRVGLEPGKLGGSLGNYEILFTSLNGQSFVGETIEWNDVHLSVKSDIPETILKDATLPFTVYAKDIRGHAVLRMRIVTPTGEEHEVIFADGGAEYVFEQLGTYKVVITAVGSNNNEVVEEYEIVVKSSVDPVEITLDDTYRETYEQNETVTVIGAQYSENVAEARITITTPNGDVLTVAAGDQYRFAVPGIYLITYTARDAAEPTPNENTVTVTINVPDTEKPVVKITAPDSVKAGEKVTPTIDIQDDSEVDVTVTVTKPDGSVVTLTAAGQYAFTPDAAGSWVIKVVAEDIYGNKEQVTKTITVTVETTPGGNSGEQTPEQNGGLPVGAIVGIVAAVVVVVAAAVVIVLIKKQILFKKKQ